MNSFARTSEMAVQCSFCGYTFALQEAGEGCEACPLHSMCGKVKCPNCGFEVAVMAQPPWIVRAYRSVRASIERALGSREEAGE